MREGGRKWDEFEQGIGNGHAVCADLIRVLVVQQLGSTTTCPAGLDSLMVV